MCYEDEERKDTVIWYEDQARREDCTDYNNGGINVEEKTENHYHLFDDLCFYIRLQQYYILSR